MKRLVTTLGILVMVGLLAAPALAHRQGWGRYYGGPGYCWQDSGAYANLSESQRAELNKLERKYFDDTAKLREEIWAKSAELDSVLNSSDPDAKKARTLQNEISTLRAKMGENRLNFELEARKIAPNFRFGRGYGRGYGWEHHGPGPYGHHGPGMHGQGGPYGNYGPYGGYGPPCAS